MSKKNQKPLVPKLRFPEFRDSGEWEKQKNNNLLKKISSPVKVEPDEVYQEIGIRSHGKGIFHKKPINGKELGNKRVFWVEENAFIVNIVFAWELAVASTTQAEKGMIASHRFPMYQVYENKAVVSYIKYFFLTSKGKELLWIASPGGAGRNKTLGQKEFENLGFLIPRFVEEQQRIADCLNSLDELITVEAGKLEAYKAHKKGLMQKLFPAEGETVPKLRFPEFRDSGEWVKLTLSELLTETKRRNRDLKYDREDVLSVSGEYGCVNQIELLGRSYAGVSVKEYHVVETGDIVYTKSPLKKNPFGIIKENKGVPGIVSTLYAVYRVTDKANSTYLDHYFSNDYNLNSYLQPIVRKGAKNDMKVNNFAVLGGEIFAPKLPEQQKIADCLSSLDEPISAQAKKIDALKAHKKGLMQGLFPSADEVGV